MKHLGDITKINWFEVEPVDCVTGGSPCQDLSVAGKRAGLAGERSGLYMEQIRCIKELRQNDVNNGRTGAMVRPRWMVWENVPGAFSSNGGKDFAAVLEEAVRIVEPQAPSIPMPDKGWPSAGCLSDVDGKWSIAWRVHDAQFWGVPQRRKRIALVCDFGGHAAPEILFERKGLSGDTEQSGTKREEIARTAGNGIEGASGFTNRGYFTGDIAETLRSDPHGAYPHVYSKQAILYQPKSAMEENWAESETKNALRAGESKVSHAVMCSAVDCRNFTEGGEINGTLQAKGSGGQSINLQNTVRQNMVVRRLTPLECERLQGYPDGWTDIGEWIDNKGKKHKAADSPRYKALGNSIALPFWFWLLRRISAQYERPATLGSLFDGIGGFPLCWERCNGRGTALWASEIEEFPMAVTKMRFGRKEE
jgi:DNA (cytosine-5)-methyltransferase 1